MTEHFKLRQSKNIKEVQSDEVMNNIIVDEMTVEEAVSRVDYSKYSGGFLNGVYYDFERNTVVIAGNKDLALR